jgi:hypothetical protein
MRGNKLLSLAHNELGRFTGGFALAKVNSGQFKPENLIGEKFVMSRWFPGSISTGFINYVLKSTQVASICAFNKPGIEPLACF